jgi:signal transduction histidine kinase
MNEVVWYRSLYWRTALGAFACLTGLLLAQAALFLWLAGRTDRPVLSQSPPRALRLVSLDLTAALESDPALDIPQYVHEQLRRVPWRLFVVLPDGRIAKNREFDLPDEAIQNARKALQDELPTGRFERLRARVARVRVDGHVVAVVGLAPGEGPLDPVVREYGPPLLTAGLGLLVAGALGMALFVFGPARRRLRALQQAAEALGSGASAPLAPETGGDEVAALAHSFNRMAADLDARVRDLKESDRLRRQLLADVSHELMTPLTSIRGYLETLSIAGAVPDTATRDRYVQIVSSETERLESIVGDLLDLARFEGRGIALRRETVPIAWLFDRVAERHEDALRERGVELAREIAPDAQEVDGDARRLEQVLQNLVANASRHTPRGGRITLSSRRISGHVAIAISDTGTGIAPEHLPFVFDRFYKADAARAQEGAPGSGLGLSIVKAIVEAHGGRVTASGAPGGGARFEIEMGE